jgi:hypothetical protein
MLYDSFLLILMSLGDAASGAWWARIGMMIEYLRSQARRCLRLSAGIGDELAQERLAELAAEYEAQAEAREAQENRLRAVLDADA